VLPVLVPGVRRVVGIFRPTRSVTKSERVPVRADKTAPRPKLVVEEPLIPPGSSTSRASAGFEQERTQGGRWNSRGCRKGVWLVSLVGMLLCFRTIFRRGLLMQTNNPIPPSLKRPFAQTVSAPHHATGSPSQPPTPKSQRRRRSTSPHRDHQPMSSPKSHSGHNTPGSPRPGSPSGRGSHRGGSFYGQRGSHSRNNSRPRFADREKGKDTLEPPLRDEKLVKQTYQDVNISTSIVDNPKNSLANFANQILGAPLDFNCREGMINKQKLWR